jgi:hypothetical protein
MRFSGSMCRRLFSPVRGAFLRHRRNVATLRLLHLRTAARDTVSRFAAPGI